MNIGKAFAKAGLEITAVINGEERSGRAVIYPIKTEYTKNGGIKNFPEGRRDSGRYVIFADSALLNGAGYGDTVRCENDEYIVISTLQYACRYGGYMKASLRKKE